MKKLLLHFMILSAIYSCSKKNDPSDKVYDIRGTQWVSEETIFYGIGKAAHRNITFSSASQINKGDGIYTLTDDRSSAQVYLTPMEWTLEGKEVNVYFTDHRGKSDTLTGSWVLGTLYLEGNYSKKN